MEYFKADGLIFIHFLTFPFPLTHPSRQKMATFWTVFDTWRWTNLEVKGLVILFVRNDSEDRCEHGLSHILLPTPLTPRDNPLPPTNTHPAARPTVQTRGAVYTGRVSWHAQHVIYYPGRKQTGLYRESKLYTSTRSRRIYFSLPHIIRSY